MGLPSQEAIPAPRGFAIQSRVVATEAGRITGYKEPSGPGVRVDACGYLGYAPPPQFDPLLAKVIAASNSTGTFESAIDRAIWALGEFHIAGLATNLARLRGILAHPVFRSGGASTGFLAEHASAIDAASATNGSGPVSLLEKQAVTIAAAPTSSPAVAPSSAPALDLAEGDEAVRSPRAGAIVEWSVTIGETVVAGAPIAVISAMKMETVVPAPTAGVVTARQDLAPGDRIGSGQVIAVLNLVTAEGAAAAATNPDATWAPVLDRIASLQDFREERLAPGSKTRASSSAQPRKARLP